MTKKLLKKSKIMNFAYMACKDVSDSKLKLEPDAHIHFAQKPQEKI